MLEKARKPSFAGLAAIFALILGFTTVVPQRAEATDSEYKGFFPHRPHFLAELTNADTVPLVPDQGFTGTARAWLSFRKKAVVLKYWIETDMDLNAGFPLTKSEADDVTQIHLHSSPPGIAGPHVLNVYKIPAQDDDDVAVKPNQGIVMGIWDDDDLSEGLPPGPASVPLSDVLDELCLGNIYVNVHGTGDQSPGALRGNLKPTKQGRRFCRFLELKGLIF